MRVRSNNDCVIVALMRVWGWHKEVTAVVEHVCVHAVFFDGIVRSGRLLDLTRLAVRARGVVLIVHREEGTGVIKKVGIGMRSNVVFIRRPSCASKEKTQL
jgi:hypothetical protein